MAINHTPETFTRLGSGARSCLPAYAGLPGSELPRELPGALRREPDRNTSATTINGLLIRVICTVTQLSRLPCIPQINSKCILGYTSEQQGEGPEIQGDMILPEIINPGGRPGPSECEVYTARGGLLRTNCPTLAPLRAVEPMKGQKNERPDSTAPIFSE